jgi:DNA polymerase-3 subunit beta
MNLSIQRKALHAGLQSATRAVSGKSSLPILANVLLTAVGSTLKITGNDLELSIERILDDVDVQAPGGLCLPAKLLSDLVGSLPDGLVTIIADESGAGTITCGKSVYRINGLPPIDFPPTPAVADAQCLIIGTDILRRGLLRTLSAVSRDDTRPILTGVRIEVTNGELRFVSTDTHRLALDKSPLADAPEMAATVPGRAMRELVPLLADAEACRCLIGENEASFAIGATTVTTRLLEGSFPKYERVIPTEHTHRIELGADELKRAVKRAGIVARENANRLGFDCPDGTLLITASSGDLGECREEVPIQARGDGEVLPFCLNATYLLDCLDALGGDTVSFEGTQPLSPFVLRNPKDASASLLVIMPMQSA